MIIVNLFFLKNINGMFYYGMDYIGSQSATLLVKKGLRIKKNDYPNLTIIELDSILQLIVFLYKNNYKVLFTPTPHPIPFFKRQFVTLHDFYPFHGLTGFFKYLLFVVGSSTSKSKTLVINKYVKRSLWLYLQRNSIIFAPNFISTNNNDVKPSYPNFKYGLIGTDSEKKNYSLLLTAMPKNFIKHFALYGNDSSYAKQLIILYGKLGLTFVDSEKVSLNSFIEQCSSVVSVAKGEGFARPIAASINAGKPVFLINDPVFKEFYEGCAIFHEKIDELVLDLVANLHTIDDFDHSIHRKNFLSKVCQLKQSFYEARRLIFGI